MGSWDPDGRTAALQETEENFFSCEGLRRKGKARMERVVMGGRARAHTEEAREVPPVPVKSY